LTRHKPRIPLFYFSFGPSCWVEHLNFVEAPLAASASSRLTTPPQPTKKDY
jgi:hypothetical protein